MDVYKPNSVIDSYLSGTNNLKITQAISGRGNPHDIDEVLKKVNLYDRRWSSFKSFSCKIPWAVTLVPTKFKYCKLVSAANWDNPLSVIKVFDKSVLDILQLA